MFNILARLDTDRLIHSLKTALACLLGYLIFEKLHFDNEQWVIITIIVVMCAQLNVGSVLQKSYMRFLGTAIGAIIATLTLVLFGKNEAILIGCVSLVALLFSYLATSTKSYNETGTLGAATTAIILIGPNATLYTAAARTLEITVGIIIAAFISQFVFPIRARTDLRRKQAITLRQLRDYYELTLMSKGPSPAMATAEDIEETIIASITQQRKLAKEAGHEFLGKSFHVKAFNLNAFKKSLHCEKQMLRSVIFMRQAHKLSPTGKDFLNAQLSIQEFNSGIYRALTEIAEYTDNPNSLVNSIATPEIKNIGMISEAAIQQLSPQDYLYVSNFIFCAEMLVTHLQEFIALKMARAKS